MSSRWWCLSLIATLLILPACAGGRGEAPEPNAPASQDQQQEDATPGTVKPKPNIETRPTVLFPGVFERHAELNRAKPGHWAEARQPVIAHHNDLQLEMSAHAIFPISLLPIPVPGTPFFVRTVRSVVLPKGEQKILETMVMVPTRPEKAAVVVIRIELVSPAGIVVHSESQPIQILQPFQNHIVVLSKTPDRYRVLRLIDAVALPVLGNMVAPPFYHVVLPTAGHPVPIPRNVFAWTTIAYVLWDDFSPQDLDAFQQQAMLDWLHFGGQLIINGPTSMSSLRGSFLEPYLPADSRGAKNLIAADFEELNQNWSIPMAEVSGRRELQIPNSSPMIGLSLDCRPGCEFVNGTGSLVAESQVGRGRIVVTAVNLQDPRLRQWQSFSGFFHGAILRRPARTFDKSLWGEVSFRWKKNQSSVIFDPLLATTLRFTSRDLWTSGTSPEIHWHVPPLKDASDGGWPGLGGPSTTREDEPMSFFIVSGSTKRDLEDVLHFGGYDAHDQAGTGGWNDHQGIAAAAREILTNAAGITPPTRTFVLRMLLGYLAVLAVVNWGFFKLIGRVEWAWAAMPIVALIGAFVVVRSAQLDIGFVRSETKVGLLELHGGYERGHLTQFTGVYSSLSTRFHIDFPSSHGLAAPFAYRPDAAPGPSPAQAITFRRDASHQFRNIVVQSNSTGMTHEEDFIQLRGPIQAIEDQGSWRLENNSELELEFTGVLWREGKDHYRLAWLGRCNPGTQRPLDFHAIPLKSLYNSWRSEVSLASNQELARTIWRDLAGHLVLVRSGEASPSNESNATAAAIADGNWLRSGLLPLDVFLGHPLLVSQADDFLEIYQRTYQRHVVDQRTGRALISREQFLRVYAVLHRQQRGNGLNLGPILDMLAGQLQLGIGEMRLIARVNDPLGEQQLSPPTTQSQHGTIVLVHLRGAHWPLAEADSNTIYDFAKRSELEYLFDDSQFDDRQRLDLDQHAGDDDE
ncbi:MAG TPA: hypothetical protein PKD54_11670 [Pirellulaceae bacterium]|nr:hypothetical protein [Pirellulaceae bacterium]